MDGKLKPKFEGILQNPEVCGKDKSSYKGEELYRIVSLKKLHKHLSEAWKKEAELRASTLISGVLENPWLKQTGSIDSLLKQQKKVWKACETSFAENFKSSKAAIYLNDKVVKYVKVQFKKQTN